MKKNPDSILNAMTHTFNSRILFLFFNDLYKSNWNTNSIDQLSFNTFANIPYSISEKIYHALKKKLSQLSDLFFIKGMIKLYSESLLKRLRLIFTILDFNKTHSINIKNVKYILLHFHCITNKTNAKALLEQVDKLFQGRETLTFNELLRIVKEKTSNAVLVLLFFFYHYLPVDDISIGYYENSIDKQYDVERNDFEPMIHRGIFTDAGDKKTFSLFKHDFNTANTGFNNVKREKMRSYSKDYNVMLEFAKPSSFLYNYLEINFKAVFQFEKDTTNQQEKEEYAVDDNDDDLKELSSFEVELTEIKSDLSYMKKHSANEIKGTSYTNNNNKEENESAKTNFDSFKQELKAVILSKEIKKNDRYASFHSDKESRNRDLTELKLSVSSHSNKKEKMNMSSIYLFEMSNNQTLFSNLCLLTDNDKNQYDTKVTLIGNIIFIANKISEGLYQPVKLLMLTKLYASSIIQCECTVSLISTLKGVKEYYKMTFDSKDLALEFISLVHHKTNYRQVEDYYNIKRILGKGVSGVVKLVQRLNTQNYYAMKILPLNYKDRADLKLVYNELDICKLFINSKETQLTYFIDYYETIEVVYIIMEYFNSHTLESFMKIKPKEFQKNKQVITTNLINSFQLFNYYGVIHRDIKPQNIMISQTNGQYQAKIIDFGFAKIISESDTLHGALGTYAYASPEIIYDQAYDFKTDIWSLGVLLYEFVYGKLPFVPMKNHDYDENTMAVMIKENISFSEGLLINKIDNYIKTIAKMCLVKESTYRANIDMIHKQWNNDIK